LPFLQGLSRKGSGSGSSFNESNSGVSEGDGLLDGLSLH
jgi:hypothetical protein